MKKLINLSILLLLVLSATTVAGAERPSIIIVHGTNVQSKDNWHRPGGRFFEAVANSAKPINATVSCFEWDSKASSMSRLHAATELAKLILKQEGVVYLIGHSHGGNVINLASSLIGFARSQQTDQPISTFAKEMLRLSHFEYRICIFCYKLLGYALHGVPTWLQNSPSDKNRLPDKIREACIKRLAKPQRLYDEITYGQIIVNPKDETVEMYEKEICAAIDSIKEAANTNPVVITQSFLLATPVNTICYAPNPDVIRHTYLIYSGGDIVQQVCMLYKNRYAPLKHITNISAHVRKTPLDKKRTQPAHNGLHAQHIGAALLNLPNLFKETSSPVHNVEFYCDGSTPRIVQ